MSPEEFYAKLAWVAAVSGVVAAGLVISALGYVLDQARRRRHQPPPQAPRSQRQQVIESALHLLEPLSSPAPGFNDQMSRALAHDFKEPARTAFGFVDMILSDPAMDVEQRRDFLERTHSLLQRLLDMHRELEEYTVALGATGNCITPRRMVEQTLDLMRDKLGEAMVDVTLDVPDDVEVPAIIARVLQNLLDNSVKYAGEEALEVSITATLDGSDLLVQVTDNGMGFDPEQVSYIFEPFHRLDPHRERPGMGMGLALCRDLVSKYGGRIWATSSGLGEGAAFAFRVPVHQHDDEESLNEPTDGVAH